MADGKRSARKKSATRGKRKSVPVKSSGKRTGSGTGKKNSTSSLTSRESERRKKHSAKLSSKEIEAFDKKQGYRSPKAYRGIMVLSEDRLSKLKEKKELRK